MSYVVVIVLLVLAAFVEFLLIRKGMLAGKRSSQSIQGSATAAAAIAQNRSVSSPTPPPSVNSERSPDVEEAELEEPEASATLPDHRENVIAFPEKPAALRANRGTPREPEPQAAAPAIVKAERSMADIIKEIRGDNPPPRREFSLLRSTSPKPGPDTALTPLSIPEPESPLEQDKVVAEDAAESDAVEYDEYEEYFEDIVADDTDDADGIMDDADEIEAEDEAALGEPVSKRDDDHADQALSPEEQLKIGLEMVRQSRLDEGIAYIEAAIQHVSERADAHFNLGIAYTLQDEIPRAISAYQQAIRIDPKYGKAFYNLGTLHLKQGNIQDAILNLEQAAKLLPDPMKALWNLYEAYRSDGLFTKALVNLQRLIELEPDDASLYNHLGICYVKLGDYGKAINAWKKSISLGASSQLIHYNLGKTYELYGELSNARKHYELFVKLTTNAEEWQELVAEVQERLTSLRM